MPPSVRIQRKIAACFSSFYTVFFFRLVVAIAFFCSGVCLTFGSSPIVLFGGESVFVSSID